MASPSSLVKEQCSVAPISPAIQTNNDASDVKMNTAGDFSLQCLLQSIKVDGVAAIMSRVTYRFPPRMTVGSGEALRYAASLNRILVYSRVFVMQNIDGDRSYSLRMDTLLRDPQERDSVAQFLDNITLDITVLTRYFCDQSQPQRVAEPQLALR